MKSKEQGLWSQNDWSSTPFPPRYWPHDLGAGNLASLSLSVLLELGIEHSYHLVAAIKLAPIHISGLGLITLDTVTS